MNKYLLFGGGLLVGATIVTATLAYKPNFIQNKPFNHNSQKSFENNENYDLSFVNDIKSEELSEAEKEELIYHYAEEKMARDVYQNLYEKYGLNVFNMISRSEQMHMDVVTSLLEKYDLEKPEGYGLVEDMYNSLMEKGNKSLKDAIEVGIKIEIKDIQDIVANINSSEIDNKDINTALYNIGGASFNHLRGFVRNLQNQGFETDLNWQQYLGKEDINTRGPLHDKIDNFINSKENIDQSASMHGGQRGGNMHGGNRGCGMMHGGREWNMNGKGGHGMR